MLIWTLVACLPDLVAPPGSEAPDLRCDVDNWVEEEGEEPVWLGLVEREETFCGELSTTGNNGSGYTGDRDRLDFSPGLSGSWEITLDWEEGVADYDFYLLAAETNMEIQASAGTSWPQTMEAELYLIRSTG